MTRKLWYSLLILIGLLFMFRKPLAQKYLKSVTGLQAVQDAATQNGYTTYNTQIYRDPWWYPLIQFSKAGSYVPGGKGKITETFDYSVQG
jgi:hypothetical protein